MKVRQISISEFKARCTAEIREVEKGNVILQVTRHGKPVAIIEPSKPKLSVPLADWVGSGCGSVTVLRDEALTAPSLAWHEDAQDVWSPLTIEQHIARQLVPRVVDFQDLLGDGTEEEWEGFDEELLRWRQEQPIPTTPDTI